MSLSLSLYSSLISNLVTLSLSLLNCKTLIGYRIFTLFFFFFFENQSLLFNFILLFASFLALSYPLLTCYWSVTQCVLVLVLVLELVKY